MVNTETRLIIFFAAKDAASVRRRDDKNNKVSLITQSVKNLPAVQETWVQFLDWEDTLEKEMATHSSILAWRIPRTEEPGRLHSMGLQESNMT